MTLLYGTGNMAKVTSMQNALENLEIKLLSLADMGDDIPDVAENGKTPLENARLKALAYYNAFKIPVFSCDSGLYFDNMPDKIQPGVSVRRVNEKSLSDEEMIDYYAGLAKKHGDLTARYRNAICLIINPECIYESTDESLRGERFILTSCPHEKRVEGFPLDSISIHIESGKYYYDMVDDDTNKSSVNFGFKHFFKNVMSLEEKQKL